jgi:PTS system nitrogen regulatory IIA component
MLVDLCGRVKAGLGTRPAAERAGDGMPARVEVATPAAPPYRLLVVIPLGFSRILSSMADADFDVDRLAAYLHRMPADITRLAERGKLPGRRVGGAWRFSAAEIHHWMEDRIGLSDDDELAVVEGTLDRAGRHGEDDEISSAALLHPESVAVPLLARTRGSVIADMAGLAAATHLLWDAGAMADAVRAREAMYSTALDNGVALLHPRRPMAGILAEAVLALGITPGGIPFGATAGARGQLTDVFFLICSTSDHEHLRILARLSRVISDADFLAALRAAPDAIAARELVVQREACIRAIGDS